MSTERDYNGVTIKESWSFVAFCAKYGKPKFANNLVNPATGEVFNALAFPTSPNKPNAEDGKYDWCHFGYSTQGMTAKDIITQREDLKVGLNSNNKLTLFKQSANAWEDLNW